MSSTEEKVVEIKVNEERLEHLLETNDVKDRGAVLDMIKELTDQIGALMPESTEKNFRKYASLPALQMLLVGIVTKDEEAVDLASAMLMLDVTIVEHDYESEDLESAEETKAC